jgi:cytochrome c-type biogenesis protein CcmH/NrfF
MANSPNTGRVNSILLLIIGLLVGVIAGYMYGKSENPGGQAMGGTASSVLLNDRLAEENQWIVQGLNCPMAGCTNPLLECQGELSRRIRDWVNSQLAAGRSGQDIRNEIIRTHGDNLFKTYPRPGADSLR